MPKLLKKNDVDLFDYGKAITLILSKTKELNKTHNTLVDDIQYLESRKKQETTDLERLIAEKEDIIKLKSELTQKIIKAKSDFMTEVSAKKEELAIQIADMDTREAKLAEETAKSQDSLAEQRNELELRQKELEKERTIADDALKSQDADLKARETQIVYDREAINEDIAKVQSEKSTIADEKKLLDSQREQIANKSLELDNREAALADKENTIETQRSNLASLAADLENQASLIEREKSKNKADIESIRTMNKRIQDKQAELNNKEIHLNDRASTLSTHQVV